MATITEIKLKSGDTSYKAVIKNDGKILKSKRWSTRKAALTWANRIENDHEMMEALSSDAATMTFKVLADDYIKWWRTQDRKDQGTEARIQWWSDRLGDKKVLDIQDRHIRKILDTYAQGKAKRGNGRKKSKVMDRPRKPATINRMRSGLCAVFKYANKIKGYKIPSPAKYIPTLTENNKRVRYLSDDERKALLDACKASKWDKLHLLVMMAITTGARLGEFLGLSWSDIDFPARTATLNVTKNGERRVLTLAPVTIKTLTPWRQPKRYAHLSVEHKQTLTDRVMEDIFND